MRVTWVIYGAITQTTGGYIYDRLVVERLRELDVTVELLSIEPRIHHRTLTKHIVATSPDIVVGDALCIADLAIAFEALGAGCSRLLLIHHLTSWEISGCDIEASRAEESRTIAACDRIVVTSDGTAERLRCEYPNIRCDVVEPGADRLPSLPRRPAGSAELGLLFVGHLTERKGALLLLDALERLSEPRLRLRMAGDESRDSDYSEAVRLRILGSAYLRNHVCQLGLLSDPELAEQYARADALVMSSCLEGYGMVMAEALHAGLPLIATRVGFANNDYESNPACLLVDSHDENSLAAALCRFVVDSTLRQRMQTAAQSGSGRLTTWHAAGARFYECLCSARD